MVLIYQISGLSEGSKCVQIGKKGQVVRMATKEEGSALLLSQAVQQWGWRPVSARISRKQGVEVTGGLIVLPCCVFLVIWLWRVFGSASNRLGRQPGVWSDELPAKALVTPPSICVPCSSLFTCAPSMELQLWGSAEISLVSLVVQVSWFLHRF